jgi:hypothetical protein
MRFTGTIHIPKSISQTEIQLKPNSRIATKLLPINQETNIISRENRQISSCNKSSQTCNSSNIYRFHLMAINSPHKLHGIDKAQNRRNERKKFLQSVKFTDCN